MEVATRLFDHLINTGHAIKLLGWKLEEIEHYRQLLRYAALLHDIGHPPLSHASEGLLPEGYRHEEYTYRIILDPGCDYRGLDGDLGLDDWQKVAEISTGTAKDKHGAFLSELLTGDLGADRLDYLLRDSYHLGVAYGKFDAQRLLNTFSLCYDEEKQGPTLVVEEGGVHTVEGLLLARYFMFLEVYFHKTRRILDAHLTEFLRKVLPKPLQTYPPELGDYLQWDDNRLFSELACHADDIVFSRLFRRQHFRLAWETSDYPEKEEIERFDWLFSELKQKYGADVLLDEASKAPYNYEKPPVLVSWRGSLRPIEKHSPLVRNLRKIEKMRIYSVPERRNDIEEECRRFWQEREDRRRSE